MADIAPFRGILYNLKKIDNYRNVVTPPYDVISEEMREDLYAKNDNNVIRLILGKELEGDTDENNKYTRAREILNEWIGKGILKKDAEDSYYVYTQEYEVDGKKCRRTGFIGLMKIEESDEKEVLPHEHTHAGPPASPVHPVRRYGPVGIF